MKPTTSTLHLKQNSLDYFIINVKKKRIEVRLKRKPHVLDKISLKYNPIFFDVNLEFRNEKLCLELQTHTYNSVQQPCIIDCLIIFSP